MRKMRHCRNCRHCVVNYRAIELFGIWIKKCTIKGGHILHPFWSGWRCKEWGRKL